MWVRLITCQESHGMFNLRPIGFRTVSRAVAEEIGLPESEVRTKASGSVFACCDFRVDRASPSASGICTFRVRPATISIKPLAFHCWVTRIDRGGTEY